MRLRLYTLQDKDKQAWKIRAEHSEGWNNINRVLHHQGLLYITEIIQTKLISRYQTNLLADHFHIEKTCEFVAQKYYWLLLCHNVKNYVKRCNICLASKIVQPKLYCDLQFLSISTHRWKDLLMDFIMSLPISKDWKGNSYDMILIIVNRFIKMVYYELIKVTIDAPGLAEVIINVIIRHYGLLDSIITDWELLFTSKFWSLLCYFLDIKQKLSHAFYS